METNVQEISINGILYVPKGSSEEKAICGNWNSGDSEQREHEQREQEQREHEQREHEQRGLEQRERGKKRILLTRTISAL